MTTKKFTPLHIGCNQEAIDKQVDNWQYTAKILNELAVTWNSVFNEGFTVKLLREILFVKKHEIERFLQIRFINLDPEYAKFAGKFKIDEALRITQFPEFGILPDQILNVKEFIYKNIQPVEFDKWIEVIFVDEKFTIPATMITEIEIANDYFTTTHRENFVLALTEQFVNTINIFNNLGSSISEKNLPPVLRELVTSISSGMKHEILRNHIGDDKYNIMWLEPNFNLHTKKQTIFRLLENNTNAEVAEMYKSLTSNQ